MLEVTDKQHSSVIVCHRRIAPQVYQRPEFALQIRIQSFSIILMLPVPSDFVLYSHKCQTK